MRQRSRNAGISMHDILKHIRQDHLLERSKIMVWGWQGKRNSLCSKTDSASFHSGFGQATYSTGALRFHSSYSLLFDCCNTKEPLLKRSRISCARHCINKEQKHNSENNGTIALVKQIFLSCKDIWGFMCPVF